MSLRLGTRASALAQWQAQWVAGRLRDRNVDVELVPITTAGDRKTGTIAVSGVQGAFTKEIERALLERRIDLAVHSLKDLPTTLMPGLCLAAVPERAPPGDVLVCPEHGSLDALRCGAAIGTGSPRRRAQLRHYRQDLQMKDIRGNLDTRLRKLDEGRYDAIVLAEAGLCRLGLEGRIAARLPLEILLPAAGQGALGLEIREDDAAIRAIVAPLDHPPTHAAVGAERAMLSGLRAGCLAPVAALATVEQGQLSLVGRVLSVDGTCRFESRREDAVFNSKGLGHRVAEALLIQGAGECIHARD